MKKMIAVFLTAGLFFSSLSLFAQKSYNIDKNKSTVKWYATKVTGEHDGTVSLSYGKMEMENGKLTGGKVHVDMNSIVVLDIKDAGTNQKLVNHLKSEDFFFAEKHPTAVFTMKEVKYLTGSDREDKYELTGDMYIRGISKEVTVPLTVRKAGESYIAEAKFTLDRSRWNVKFNSGSFFENLGDKLIHDEFNLDMQLFFDREMY